MVDNHRQNSLPIVQDEPQQDVGISKQSRCDGHLTCNNFDRTLITQRNKQHAKQDLISLPFAFERLVF